MKFFIDCLPGRLANTHKPLPLQTHQRGVVLVISLILLGVLSLMAATSLRNVGLSESLSNNVRTTELATRAAEVAIRYCEENASTSVITDVGGPFWNTKDNKSNTLTYWDGPKPKSIVIPSVYLSQDKIMVTFKRMPECMVEKQLKYTDDGSGIMVIEDTYVVTARGFGPDVELGTGRPKGTEIWLQTFIE